MFDNKKLVIPFYKDVRQKFAGLDLKKYSMIQKRMKLQKHNSNQILQKTVTPSSIYYAIEIKK